MPDGTDALAQLERIKHEMHERFGEHHAARLGQLDAALATARMAIEHLVDEDARETELAQRIVNRAKVHGDGEVVSPVGRSFEQTLQIARAGREA